MKRADHVSQPSQLRIGQSANVLNDWLWLCELGDQCNEFYQNAGREAARNHVSRFLTTEAFQRALRCPHAVIRRRAVHLALLMPREEAISGLEEVLIHDACPVVRHEAAFYLGALGAKEALKVLIDAMLRDPDPLVRHEAAEALGDMKAEEARGELYLAVRDGCEAVKRTATIALQQLDL